MIHTWTTCRLGSRGRSRLESWFRSGRRGRSRGSRYFGVPPRIDTPSVVGHLRVIIVPGGVHMPQNICSRQETERK